MLLKVVLLATTIASCGSKGVGNDVVINGTSTIIIELM